MPDTNGDTPPSEWTVHIVLDKSTRNSGNVLKMTFYFMQLSFYDENPPRYDCTLTTIGEKGKQVAEGMEFTMIPSIVNDDGFTTDTVVGDNTWIAEKVGVDVGESREESLIRLVDVTLKMWRGQYMARATFEASGEVLMTQVWED